MKPSDGEANLSELKRSSTFKDFIWQNYSIAEMKDELAKDRED